MLSEKPPLLQVQGLTKRFDVPGRAARVAVDALDFSLRAGEALGLVGESGSGKSTTAALVARLADADAGRILLRGTDIAAVPARSAARAPWRGEIQMVFQDPLDSLDPRATAREAIADPLRRLRGLRGAALAAAVRDAADRSQIASTLLDRRPHELSGGQAARVGIARAIAPAPALLILDEPTSALDVSVQVGVLQLLEQLRRDSGMAYLFISHDLQVVRLLCERVLVMHEAHIVEQGPTEQVLARPAHPYTAALAAALPKLPLLPEHAPAHRVSAVP
ncbi:ABC-type glutathione transport system ATPase component [Pseudacidovorax sp. 1753]|uniref:ABC transporter ATP-binding protein n=1 Tax=Pseudacidovorax sp. 1753 TaxID=3156419 RepID=UPI00339AD57A